MKAKLRLVVSAIVMRDSNFQFWINVIAFGAVVISCLVPFFEIYPPKNADAAPKTPELLDPDDLGLCDLTWSLDGHKRLFLNTDHLAEIEDDMKRSESNNVEDSLASGTWRYEPISGRYAVTLEGLTVLYSRISPIENVCLLVKGEIGAADLNASWFAGWTHDDPD